ncbi:MAG: hypothetical protein L6265_02150, partial [Thermoplasmatales archaeon]|nr:hypothetical protein [Thermoplasmatales archaeon]
KNMKKIGFLMVICLLLSAFAFFYGCNTKETTIVPTPPTTNLSFLKTQCRTRKLFRYESNIEKHLDPMVKLNNKIIKWIVKNVSKNEISTKDAADIYKVSQRRVQQLAKKYSESGEIPKLNWNRRPRTYLTEEQKQAIDRAWKETRLGSKLLYFELKEKRGTPVPKNKLIKYLKENGRSIPNPNKQKIRKRCRYERKHTCSLIHGDFHRRTENDPHAIAWLDDASRKIIAGDEFKDATAENAINTFKEAQKHIEEYNISIREVNTDRGSQFYCNKGEGQSQFEKYLDTQRIVFIPSRRNNPQTNGKLERFWYEYDKHRFRFNSFQEFVNWYNNRIHGALWLEYGENPNEAFTRKLPMESILGLFMKMDGW